MLRYCWYTKYAYGLPISFKQKSSDAGLRVNTIGGGEGRGQNSHCARNIIAFDTDANTNHSGDVITAGAEKGDPSRVFGVHIHTRRVLSLPHKCQIKSCYTFNVLPGFACIIQGLIPVK